MCSVHPQTRDSSVTVDTGDRVGASLPLIPLDSQYLTSSYLLSILRSIILVVVCIFGDLETFYTKLEMTYSKTKTTTRIMERREYHLM